MTAEEKKRHSSILKPFSYYKCFIPYYFASVPMHWHAEFEINYVLSGNAEFKCGDVGFVSEEGDIIIILPNTLHSIYPYENKEQRYDTLVFSSDMLGAADNDRSCAECISPVINRSLKIVPRITKEHPYYEEIRTSVENIFSCAKGDSPKLYMPMKSELLRLFWFLEESGDIFAPDTVSAERSEIIRPAISYIAGNFQENITIERLAEKTHLSKSYFMSCFKKAAGIGATEYIIQLRIKNACECLKNTDNSAANIAFESGFRSISNFNRQFRRIVGCTPNEYRKITRSYLKSRG